MISTDDYWKGTCLRNYFEEYIAIGERYRKNQAKLNASEQLTEWSRFVFLMDDTLGYFRLPQYGKTLVCFTDIVSP
jgi:hypothetical protein